MIVQFQVLHQNLRYHASIKVRIIVGESDKHVYFSG